MNPRRWGVALRHELRTQVRYRFLHAAVFSGLLWLAMLLPIPYEIRPTVEPYALFGDLTIVGYFFIAASVFFDRDEAVTLALATSPLRIHEYLAAKLVVLSGLTVGLAITVATVTTGTGYDLGLLVAGTLPGALIMVLAGLTSALPFRSVSDWFMLGALPLAVLTCPLLHYAGVWTSPILYAVPTHGPVLLIGAAFDQAPLTGGQLGYALGYPVVAAAGLFLLAQRLFRRYAVTGGAA